jgi:hypothetical protein
MTLNRSQNILTINILQLQLNPKIGGIWKEGSGSISCHDHASQTGDNELLECWEVLNNASCTIQEIHRLKQIDLLWGL